MPRPESGIALIAPASPVHPDDTSIITVTAARELSIRRLAVLTASDYDYSINGSRRYDVSGNGPWSLPYPVPLQAIGELKVYVIAFRTNERTSDLTSNEIAIPIDLGAVKLAQLAIKGPFGCEVNPTFTDPIRLIGTFSDGIDRNCSNVKLGTTYTSSDPAVVAIDSNGGATCLKLGTAVITARYGGYETRAEVNVYPDAH
jgi:hypothetical protein